LTVDGLVTVPSDCGLEDMVRQLEAAIRSRGMTIFAHIDHAAAAAEVGLALRPTRLLIFGHAKAGTPLMQAVQTIGIDLPLRVLVWQDEAGRCWLGYNEPHWLANRHGIGTAASATLDSMTAMLQAVAEEAVAPVTLPP
jgi:uncharacterized protein (DUF302 family)